jgi:hypothetical protein
MVRDDEKEAGADKAEETPHSTAGATTDAEATAEGEGDGEAPAEAKPGPKGTRSVKARREREGRSARAANQQRAKRNAANSGASRLLLVGAVTLAAGLGAGWFGHEARAKAKLQEPSGPAAVGSSGPCKQWEGKICAGSGDESATCQQAKSAAELLTPPICENALSAVPATLAKAKAARAPCDTLITKACNDLPKGSSTCKMVQERTGSFPVERCKEMLEQYDQVIQELQGIEAQGGPPMGAPGHGQGMPPGMPPDAHP